MKKRLLVLLCGILLLTAASCDKKDIHTPNESTGDSTFLEESREPDEVLELSGVEQTEYYRIEAWNHGPLGSVTTFYRYEIYNRDGESVLSEETDRALAISMMGEGVLEIRIGGERGTCRYYDVENDRFSEVFSRVVAVSDKRVAYVHAPEGEPIYGSNLVVRHMFDRQELYQCFGLDLSPTMADPIQYAEFTEERLLVTYLTGRSPTETITTWLPLTAEATLAADVTFTFFGSEDGSCHVRAIDSDQLYQSAVVPAFSPVGERVTVLSSFSFCGWEQLRSVTLPQTLKKISPYCFDGCDALQTIYFQGSEGQWRMIEGCDQIDDRVEIVFAQDSDFASYDSILRLWRDVTAGRLCEEYATADALKALFTFSATEDTEREWLAVLIDAADRCASEAQRDGALTSLQLLSYGYALQDTNADGEKELLLLRNRETVLAAFGMRDGKPILLDTRPSPTPETEIHALYSFSDRAFAAEVFGAVLRNEMRLADGSLLKELDTPYDNIPLSSVNHYLYVAMLDMDGDGNYEQIIDTGDGVLVLRCHAGQIVCHSFTFRQMYYIETDGRFSWNHTGTDFAYGEAKLSFADGGMRVDTLWKILNDGSEDAAYYIGDEQVTRETLLSYLEEHETEEALLLPILPPSVFEDPSDTDVGNGK